MTSAAAATAASPARGGWRRYAVVVAAAAVVVPVATVAIEGTHWVNLDTALHEPVLFYALLVIPLVTAFAAVVVALPPILAVNVAVFVALLTLVEGVARMELALPPVPVGEPEAENVPVFYVPDAALGYTVAPSALARHRLRVGESLVYDVTYRTDEHGRRDTPLGARDQRRSFLLFLGDSNTFGEGLAQDETLAYYVGEEARDRRPYNYGLPGWGPTHALTLARLGRFSREIAEHAGDAVYFFIPAHVARVIGTSAVSTAWGRHFPYYRLGPGGELVDGGDFVHGRPLTTLGYFFWTKVHLASYFGMHLPPWHTAYDYRLTAKVMSETRRLLGQQVDLRHFVVVLAQTYNEPQRAVVEGVRRALAAENVQYLDYTRLFDTSDVRYRVSEHDYHNSALANRRIAARLAADLASMR